MGEPGTKDILNLADLEAAGGIHTGRKHIISLLVENKPGVLARIAGLFSRRGFNIQTLAVGPTDDPTLSRMTLTVDGALQPIDQVTKQLHKLVNVIKIRDLDPGEAVARELALFKVSADSESRGQIMQFTDIFRGKVIDVSKRAVTVEITGTDDKIEAFERMVRPFGLIEMVRTGEIAIARGRARFSEASREWRGLADDALVDDPASDVLAPPASGAVLVGGFAFSPNGGSTPEWSSFGSVRLALPEVSLVRRGDAARLTVNVAVGGAGADEEGEDGAVEAPLAAVDARV